MRLIILITALLLSFRVTSQDWSLKLRSRVELRTWKLSTRADKTEKSLTGATVVLHKGPATIAQTITDGDGNFEIDIPANGDFILTITYAGCNTKKFFVSTKGVPEAVGKDQYKPTISIGG